MSLKKTGYIPVEQKHIALCEGNPRRAMLLALLEMWWKANKGGACYLSASDMSNQLSGLLSVPGVRKTLRWLENKQLIRVRRSTSGDKNGYLPGEYFFDAEQRIFLECASISFVWNKRKWKAIDAENVAKALQEIISAINAAFPGINFELISAGNSVKIKPAAERKETAVEGESNAR